MEKAWLMYQGLLLLSDLIELRSFRPKVVLPKVISPTPQCCFTESHYIHHSSPGNFVKLHESICNLFFIENLKYTVIDIILYLIKHLGNNSICRPFELAAMAL